LIKREEVTKIVPPCVNERFLDSEKREKRVFNQRLRGNNFQLMMKTKTIFNRCMHDIARDSYIFNGCGLWHSFINVIALILFYFTKIVMLI
jgi:hypothetical protein